MDLDFSRVHAAPGLGQPLDSVPASGDPLYVRDPIGNALVEEDFRRLEFLTYELANEVMTPWS